MSRIDSSMDSLSNADFITTYGSLIKQFSISTDFTYNEVLSIMIVYYKFVCINGTTVKKMTKNQFYKLFSILFHNTDETIIDRILINISRDIRYVQPDAWIHLFSILLTKDIKIRLRFAYDIYTNSGTVKLNREVVTIAVDNFFKGDDDDEVNELRTDMVEFVFKKFDTDRDGIISYEEYAEVAYNQPPLVEFLGQMFPGDDDITLIALCTNIISRFENEIYDE